MPVCYSPEVTKRGMLDCQVCVPSDYSDIRVKEYADLANPAGTELGWIIRKEGDPILRGAPERQPCKQREGCVHIMLDC